ncbi:MAG: HD domain-containing protein [Acidobacteria bacterium]|nr:HD domain-containing protein [Acidobacteriota bacterium]
MALGRNNFRRLLVTFGALADLAPTLTGATDFLANAEVMLRATLEAAGAREGILFTFSERPALLRSAAVCGLAALPDPSLIPLLPRQVYALTHASGPQLPSPDGTWRDLLTSNGNVAPQLFHCLAPLRVNHRLVGLLALGRPTEGGQYDAESLEIVQLLAHYIALAVQNQSLAEKLDRRVSENLRLLASLNDFCDHTLEAFAAAIDVKHVHIHGHSVRVGHYAAGIGEAMGLEPSEVAALRSAGYLHDIGKVAIDKRLFSKPERLDDNEFREVAEHTLVGHRIVAGVEFPWPELPDVVRWHHERADGSGYPDRLRQDEVPLAARIMAVADTFDAMISERPWRPAYDLGHALGEIVRLSPDKYDAAAVQALLIQVRRYAVDRSRQPGTQGLFGAAAPTARVGPPAPHNRFLGDQVYCNIAPTDVDNLASDLNYRLNRGRTYQLAGTPPPLSLS